MLFTSKRVLFVDNKTTLLSGKKVCFLHISSGNAGQIDAGDANRMFHEEPNNILQPQEFFEMAF